MNFISNAKKNTVSFSGASFAPSCHAFEKNTANMLSSGTALAVSVLFSLIAILALIILNAIIGINLISMLTIAIIATKTIIE